MTKGLTHQSELLITKQAEKEEQRCPVLGNKDKSDSLKILLKADLHSKENILPKPTALEERKASRISETLSLLTVYFEIVALA